MSIALDRCPRVNADDRVAGAQWLCAPPHAAWRDAEAQSFHALFASIQRHGQPMRTPVRLSVSAAGVQMMFRVDDAFRADARDAAAGLTCVRVPDARVCSVEFGGYASEAASRRQLAELVRCTASAVPDVWYVEVYNGPYKLWDRHNQVFFER